MNKESEKCNKKNIKIILITAGIIILSTGAYIGISNSANEEKDIEQVIEIVLEKSPEIKPDLISKLVSKQVDENDYTLDTVLTTFNVNPSFIVINDEIIDNTGKIQKEINKIKNKKYSVEDVIEFVWKTTDNNFIVADIDTDIKDKVNVVEVAVMDIKFDYSEAQTNDKVPKSDLSLDDIQQCLTLDEVKEKVEKLYNFAKVYPSSLEEEKDVVEYNTFKTDNSKILILSNDGKVYLMSETLNNYDNLAKLDKETFVKISENKELTETEFLELVTEKKVVKVEIDNNSVKTDYVIKNDEGKVYSIIFKDGKFIDLELVNLED